MHGRRRGRIFRGLLEGRPIGLANALEDNDHAARPRLSLGRGMVCESKIFKTIAGEVGDEEDRPLQRRHAL
jgi:hypothetical protein